MEEFILALYFSTIFEILFRLITHHILISKIKIFQKDFIVLHSVSHQIRKLFEP